VSVTLQPTGATSRRGRWTSGRRLEGGVVAAIAIWPFLFHLPLAVRVWHGGFQHIGNDFPLLYYPYKPYLLAALADGSVPLWTPQEAGGFPFLLNPFTQSLYPANLLILPVARLLGHWGPLEHQWYALAAVSVLAVSLYLFLRKLGLSLLSAALAAIVVASSYKVTETLRFPNATHAIGCASVAVVAIAYLRVARRRAARAALGALLAFSVVSLATAGYPYFFIYFFLVLPALLLWLEFGAPAGYRARSAACAACSRIRPGTAATGRTRRGTTSTGSPTSPRSSSRTGRRSRAGSTSGPRGSWSSPWRCSSSRGRTVCAATSA
jgi:hypothetical protein